MEKIFKRLLIVFAIIPLLIRNLSVPNKRLCKVNVSRSNKLVSLFLCCLLALFFTLLPCLGTAAWAKTAPEIAAQINTLAIPGFTASSSGNTVTIQGSASNRNSTLVLDIDDGVTINWEANYSGNTVAGPLLTLHGDAAGTGNFTFNVTGSAKIENTGSGRTIQADGLYAQNVKINVEGIVAANSGTNIYTNGQNAEVTVSGNGTVYNYATTNAQVTINMTYGDKGEPDTNTKVTVLGNGSVKSLSGTGNGYAIQSYGNITISDDAQVFASGPGGRAINALSSNGVVTVNGGVVWSKNGMTICGRASITVNGGLVYNESASTKYPVIGTSDSGDSVDVIVSGSGQVEARGEGGYAISTPGAVTVSDNAKISSETGRGINISGSGSALIKGGEVSSGSGNAIHVTGGSVTIDGGTVSSKEGYAIGGSASGGVTINDGFVFAYGAGTGDVVQRRPYTSNGGFVVAWNRPAGNPPYEYVVGQNNHLAPNDGSVKWTGGGVSYNGGNSIYFIPDVVVSYPVGLFFDVRKGYFTLGSNDVEYPEQKDKYTFVRSGNSGTLTLKGFAWNTAIAGDAVALTIWDSSKHAPSINPNFELTIILEGENYFTVTEKQNSHSIGIRVEFLNLTIEGDGALNASGSLDTGTSSSMFVTFGILMSYGNITINGGNVNVVGNNLETGGIGLYVINGDIEIKGGIVTATGSGAIESVGIATADTVSGLTAPNPLGSINVTGGSVIAQGLSQAFWSAIYDPAQILLPAENPGAFTINDQAYIYWTNTNPGPNPNDSGKLFVSLTSPPGDAYDGGNGYDSSDRYVKIAATPFALVGDVEVSGKTGQALVEKKVDVTLFGDVVVFNPDRFMNENINALSWFASIPDGVTVMASMKSNNTIELTFGGTPTSTSDKTFDISIPADAFLSITIPPVAVSPIKTQPNLNAKFNIEYQVVPTIINANAYHCMEGVGGGYQLEASGTGPIAFSLAPAPAGVSINGSTLTVANSVAAGKYYFAITASNSAGNSTPQNFELTVETTAVAPTITSVNSYHCVEGTGGNLQLEAVGTAPITFSLAGAPTGVSISGNSLIVSNTVTASVYNFTITANNSAGASAPQNFELTVDAAPVVPTIVNDSYYHCVTGIGGSFQLEASGTAPITFSLTGAPAGVTISDNNLIVTNTVAASLYSFVITAENVAGKSAPQEFTLTVDEAPVVPIITSPGFYHCEEGKGGFLTLSASGTAPITFSLTGAPTGVSINGANLIVANTATAGKYYFTITAGNAAGDSAPQNFELTVETPPVAPTITSANSYHCEAGTGGFFRLTAGGTAPITFSLGGAVPAGVFISGANLIVTNAVAANTYNFTITARNAAGDSAPQNFTLMVETHPVAPQITSDNSYRCAEGTGGVFELSASGTAPITFSLSGTVPAGVSISGNNLVIAKSVAANAYNFTITASNAAGSSAPQDFTLTVDATPVVTSITSANNYRCDEGVGGSLLLTASGTAPITFSLGGTVPTGVSINGNKLVVANTLPAGVYVFTIIARNAAGDSVPQTFTLTIDAVSIIPTITSPNSFRCVSGTRDIFTITATGSAPISFTLDGAPTGVSVSGSALVVESSVTAGTYHFTITAENAAGKSIPQDFTLIVETAQVVPTITSPNSYHCVEGTGGSFQLEASGMTPITFTLGGGAPAGVSIIGANLIVSNSIAAGTYNFTITASNALGNSPPQDFTLVVHPAPIVPTIESDYYYRCLEGIGGSFDLLASGTAPITFSLAGAPAGVSINGAVLFVARTVTANVYNFTIIANNAAGDSAPQNFELTVDKLPVVPVITSPNSYHCLAGTGGSFRLEASGTAPITFLLAGAPAGVYVSGANLIVASTVPADIYSFDITASNRAGDSAPQNFTLTVDATPVIPVITSPNNYHCVANTGGVFELSASGTAPITFSLAGAPTGVYISGARLILNNTVAANVYNFTITASNSAGDSAPQNFTLTVATGPVLPVIKSANHFHCWEWTGGVFKLSASGTELITYALVGAPDGVYISGNKLVVNNTVARGIYKFTVMAKNAAGNSVPQDFTLTVEPDPSKDDGSCGCNSLGIGALALMIFPLFVSTKKNKKASV